MSFGNNGDVIQFADLLGGDREMRRPRNVVRNVGRRDCFRRRGEAHFAAAS
jgi:hypothetical protein